MRRIILSWVRSLQKFGVGAGARGEGLEEALVAGAEAWGEGLGPASGLGRVTGGAREGKKKEKK